MANPMPALLIHEKKESDYKPVPLEEVKIKKYLQEKSRKYLKNGAGKRT